jgi:serine/threonine-protein phosphatase 6 regulatory ankyrin repeat subunit A
MNPEKMFELPCLPSLDFPNNIPEIDEWKRKLLKKRFSTVKTPFFIQMTNPLRDAAISGNFKNVALYSKAYSVNTRGFGENEESILMEAIISNDSDAESKLSVVHELVKAGAFLNILDNNGRTALHYASLIDNYKIISLFLSKKAHWYIRDNNGQTPIHITAACGSPLSLQEVLKYTKGHEEINQGDNEDMTPIHWAVANNNVENVKLMLQKKYKIKTIVQDVEGKTPLHWTAPQMFSIGQDIQNTCAFMLIKSNPKIINEKDLDGRTCLHLACGENNVSLVSLLVKHSICNVNCQDDMLRTPLHWSAVAGFSNIVSVLLKNGADDSITDSSGATALHYAASKNHIQCVISLTEGRRYAYNPDLDGRMPIIWAIMKGHLQSLRNLLEKGANTEHRDKNGCTGN